jgi:hypothetical protein
MTTVQHVSSHAGDVVLFLGSGVTHGTLPWTEESLAGGGKAICMRSCILH